VEFPLSGTRADVGAGRRFVRDTLEGWGCEDVADDAALVTSELITNAVLHAHTAIALSMRRVEGRVRIEVADHSSSLPRLRNHSERSGTGRGLHLVSAVASDWGAEAVDDGKVVWVELVVRLESHTGRRNDEVAPVIDLDALAAAGGWDDDEGLDARLVA
jgi:anti-sigma regulatory factor (Ser/Thr protein kinase)